MSYLPACQFNQFKVIQPYFPWPWTVMEQVHGTPGFCTRDLQPWGEHEQSGHSLFQTPTPPENSFCDLLDLHGVEKMALVALSTMLSEGLSWISVTRIVDTCLTRCVSYRCSSVRPYWSSLVFIRLSSSFADTCNDARARKFSSSRPFLFHRFLGLVIVMSLKSLPCSVRLKHRLSVYCSVYRASLGWRAYGLFICFLRRKLS